mmetsp:Transcript_18553/g.46706  ORF Transcript_18553/g.46706 Transcript_18553/m.46706 type:complete len:125 (-) Transcript_18553:813-1187(-)
MEKRKNNTGDKSSTRDKNSNHRGPSSGKLIEKGKKEKKKKKKGKKGKERERSAYFLFMSHQNHKCSSVALPLPPSFKVLFSFFLLPVFSHSSHLFQPRVFLASFPSCTGIEKKSIFPFQWTRAP